MIRLLWTYDVVKWTIYWVWWIGLLLLLAVLAIASPKAGLALVKIVEPVSGLVRDIFWAFVPQEGQIIHEVGRLAGWLTRKAARLTNDKTQFVIQMGILDGFLFVTIFAHVGRWITMAFVRKILIRKFLEKYKVLPR